MQYVSIMYFCFFLNFFVLSQIYKSFSKTKHNCRHVMDCISKNDLLPTSAPSSAPHRIRQPCTVHIMYTTTQNVRATPWQQLYPPSPPSSLCMYIPCSYFHFLKFTHANICRTCARCVHT